MQNVEAVASYIGTLFDFITDTVLYLAKRAVRGLYGEIYVVMISVSQACTGFLSRRGNEIYNVLLSQSYARGNFNIYSLKKKYMHQIKRKYENNDYSELNVFIN